MVHKDLGVNQDTISPSAWKDKTTMGNTSQNSKLPNQDLNWVPPNTSLKPTCSVSCVDV